MSEFEPKLPQIPAPPPTAPENLPGGTILAVGIGALVIFALGVWVANRYRLGIVADRQQVAGVQRYPAHVGEPKIGIVEQVPYALQHREEDLRAKQLERLNSYGWTDRKNNVIHIPIAKAMEQMVSEQPQ